MSEETIRGKHVSRTERLKQSKRSRLKSLPKLSEVLTEVNAKIDKLDSIVTISRNFVDLLDYIEKHLPKDILAYAFRNTEITIIGTELFISSSLSVHTRDIQEVSFYICYKEGYKISSGGYDVSSGEELGFKEYNDYTKRTLSEFVNFVIKEVPSSVIRTNEAIKVLTNKELSTSERCEQYAEVLRKSNERDETRLQQLIDFIKKYEDIFPNPNVSSLNHYVVRWRVQDHNVFLEFRADGIYRVMHHFYDEDFVVPTPDDYTTEIEAAIVNQLKKIF